MSAPATDDLSQLIQNGRTAQVEWLSENSTVELIAETLTAMANTQGGMLIIGVTGASGTVIGVKDIENTIDHILQAALAIDPPLIIPMPKAHRLSEQYIVNALVPPGMPHVYAHDGRYLVREGMENIALKPRELRRLIMERGEASFETEIVRGASIDDLDWEKARAYAAKLGGANDRKIESILLKRGCLAMQDGRLRPTNAGMLLFGKEPQNFLRGAEITAVRFAGENMSDKFTRQDITGTLPDQLQRAETFLHDHLRKDNRLGSSMAREEQFEYPMEAARELVVNSIAHRDYSIGGDGVRLFLFKDRMEVISPGGLPGPVTISNIKDERFSRNPIIVQVLSDLGFIERLGYGVDRVIDLMRERTLRDPEFSETAGGFRVVLFNQVQKPEETTPVETMPSIIIDGLFRGIPVSQRQEAAIHFLHQNGTTRITNSDLKMIYPDVHPETIRRDLADLVNKKILRKLGEKRGSYYVLKTET